MRFITEQDARIALSYIPADDRTTWLTMAFAMKSEFGEAGFDAWNDWGATADNYNAASAQSTWRSAKRSGGVTIGSLIGAAKQGGWTPSADTAEPSRESVEARRRDHAARDAAEAKERARSALVASNKAKAIIAASVLEKHSYLDAKGFGDAVGLVYYPAPGKNLLIIPMRVNNDVVGVQMIDRDGAKMFLKGQRTSGAEFVFGARGHEIYCEGWATGRSIIQCIPGVRVRVCFSAGNLQRMAKTGFVVADNDKSGTGEAAAKATGLPYFLPPVIGQDYNDMHREIGTLLSGMALKKAFYSPAKR